MRIAGDLQGQGVSFRGMIDSMINDLMRMVGYQNITKPLFDGIAGGGLFQGLASALIPGLAHGGPARPNSLYEVNEQGPELLTTQGRTYLMMGAQGGHVTPVRSGISTGTLGEDAFSGTTVHAKLNVNLHNHSGQPLTARGEVREHGDGSFSANIVLDK